MLLVDQLNKDTIVVPINAEDSSGAVQELLDTLLKLDYLTATVKLFSPSSCEGANELRSR